MTLKRTPLYGVHQELGARMTPFAGWEMPVQYQSPRHEHEVVRTKAGLFDISHMGQFVVSGPDALAFIQYVATNDASTLDVGAAQYAVLCYADGGTVDDIFIYRRPDDYFIVVNAANMEKDFRWLQAHTSGFDVSLENHSEQTVMLALQGPEAQQVLQTLTDVDLNKLAFHHSVQARIADTIVFLGATGYTGEYGYELYFDRQHAELVWRTILDTGTVEPIGLAARDSLRFEAGLALYGHELNATTSPLEAGLGFAIKTGKGAFVGREALLKQRLEGPLRRLTGIEMIEKGVPREGYTVQVEGEEGVVTSGMYCPTADIYAALAYIPRHLYERDREVDVIIRGAPRRAKMTAKTFYTPAYRR